MTKKIILLPLVAIILLSSCAGKFGLQKRRYTKGYYFSVAKKNNAPVTHENEKTKTAFVKNTPVATEIVQPAAHSTAPAAQNQPAYATNFVKAAAVAKQIPVAATHILKALTASTAKHQEMSTEKNNFKPLVVSTLKQKNKGGDSGANLVVLVILCFLWFFNLIAIYVKDDHQFTLNFLITLLLDFTLIGGIIFSLLVVLDVVDLGK